jgi:hypothetical protein
MTIHQWTLKIRSLYYGDALTVGDYRVCHYMTRDWFHAYSVRRNGVQLLKVVVRGNVTRRQAWECVAAFMVDKGLEVDKACVAIGDPVAMMLCGYGYQQMELFAA